MNRKTRNKGGSRPQSNALAASLLREDPDVPFGSAFFLTRLTRFVRDRCPTPADGLPVVLLQLGDGEVLDVCHVIGLARSWVALAVHDERGVGGPPRMRTVVIPYGAIARVTFRTEAPDGVAIGFRQREPIGLLPEVRSQSAGSHPEEGVSSGARAGGVPGPRPHDVR